MVREVAYSLCGEVCVARTRGCEWRRHVQRWTKGGRVLPCTGMRVSPKGEESPVAGIWGLHDGKGRR